MTTELTQAQKRTLASRKWREENGDHAREIARTLNREWRAKNKDKVAASAAKYKAANKERLAEYNQQYNASAKGLLAGIKSRCKKWGVEFNLTIDDIIIPPTCPILGIPIEHGKGYRTDNSPSVDRIDNTVGYIKGNVHVISMRANRIKNDSTLGELRLIVEYFTELETQNDAANPKHISPDTP